MMGNFSFRRRFQPIDGEISMSSDESSQPSAASGRPKWGLSWDEETRAVLLAAILIAAGLFFWR
jgi:hypothetical protein